MLAVLSKNKSYASISIEKGILEAHGIRSWIWDTDGCSWYGDQGAIRCRLVVSSDKMGEAIEILNSDFFAVENSEQPKELHAARSAELSPPYWRLAMLFGLLAGLFLVFTDAIPPLDLPDFVLAVSSIIRLPFDFIISVGTKSLEMLNNPIIKFALFASIPVGWGLHLIDFYKSRAGFLKALGIIFIHMVTWITVVTVFLYYSTIDIF